MMKEPSEMRAELSKTPTNEILDDCQGAFCVYIKAGRVMFV